MMPGVTVLNGTPEPDPKSTAPGTWAALNIASIVAQIQSNPRPGTSRRECSQPDITIQITRMNRITKMEYAPSSAVEGLPTMILNVVPIKVAKPRLATDRVMKARKRTNLIIWRILVGSRSSMSPQARS